MFIAKPVRIISFHKTWLENDTTCSGNHNNEHTLAHLQDCAIAARNDCSQGGASGTGIGGSMAWGKALCNLSHSFSRA
eukprot:6201739-Pleurochrysis_carterae.AAC.4